MENPEFNPHFYKNSSDWFYADGSVLGGVDGDLNLTDPESTSGRALLISEWSSFYPGQGNTKRALEWLRGHFKTIVANGVGVSDANGSDDSVLYWAHMKDLGLIDEMLDDEGNSLVLSSLENKLSKPEGIRSSLASEIQDAMFSAMGNQGEVEVQVCDSGESIEIVRIMVGTEGQGLGTKAMLAACELADAHSVSMELTPSGSYQLDEEAARSRLVDFYGRFGFVESDYGTMVRTAAVDVDQLNEKHSPSGG